MTYTSMSLREAARRPLLILGLIRRLATLDRPSGEPGLSQIEQKQRCRGAPHSSSRACC